MNDAFAEPEFWDSRYRAGEVPWEAPRLPGQLGRWLGAHPARGAVLIPGCGSGREIAAFAAAGWSVTGLDFSSTALARARGNLAGREARLILDDFFTHPFAPGEFDIIYERTFLTALSPARWPACVARYAELLKAGGHIVGYCYYGAEPDPPPFFQPVDAPPVLASEFVLAEDAVSEDALPFFGARERWQVWTRRQAP